MHYFNARFTLILLCCKQKYCFTAMWVTTHSQEHAPLVKHSERVEGIFSAFLWTVPSCWDHSVVVLRADPAFVMLINWLVGLTWVEDPVCSDWTFSYDTNVVRCLFATSADCWPPCLCYQWIHSILWNRPRSTSGHCNSNKPRRNRRLRDERREPPCPSALPLRHFEEEIQNQCAG